MFLTAAARRRAAALLAAAAFCAGAAAQEAEDPREKEPIPPAAERYLRAEWEARLEEARAGFSAQQEVTNARMRALETRMEDSRRYTEMLLAVFGVSALLAAFLLINNLRLQQRGAAQKMTRLIRDSERALEGMRNEMARPEMDHLRIGQFLRGVMRRLREGSPMTLPNNLNEQVGVAANNPHLPASLHFMACALHAEQNSQWRAACGFLERLLSLQEDDADVALHLSHALRKLADECIGEEKERHLRRSYEFYARYASIINAPPVVIPPPEAAPQLEDATPPKAAAQPEAVAQPAAAPKRKIAPKPKVAPVAAKPVPASTTPTPTPEPAAEPAKPKTIVQIPGRTPRKKAAAPPQTSPLPAAQAAYDAAQKLISEAHGAADASKRAELTTRALAEYQKAADNGLGTREFFYNWGVAHILCGYFSEGRDASAHYLRAAETFLAGERFGMVIEAASAYALAQDENNCRKWLLRAQNDGVLKKSSLVDTPDFAAMRDKPWFEKIVSTLS